MVSVSGSTLKEAVYGKKGKHYHDYDIDYAAGGVKEALKRAFIDVTKLADQSWFSESYKLRTIGPNSRDYGIRTVSRVSDAVNTLDSMNRDIDLIYSPVKFKYGDRTISEYRPTRHLELRACVNHPGRSFNDGSSDENIDSGSMWNVEVEKDIRILRKDKVRVSWTRIPY